MAVSMEDVKKLRDLTSAGFMDCKKALAEANGDFDEAVKLIRERGQAVAAKRSDREATEGCVLAGVNGNFAALVAIKCETDFVARNEDFINMTKTVLDTVLAAKPATAEEIPSLKVGDVTVQDLIIERSGVTGEKMEFGGFESLTGESVVAYVHPGNKLASLVSFKESGVDAKVGKNIAMQVAGMNPVALDEASVPEDVKKREYELAVEKTKEEQVEKAVENAIKKAGINPNLVDSEDHIASNIRKGWLTEEEANKAKEIRATVSAEKAANLPTQMIENIAKGRLNKFFKESCLVDQEYFMDPKLKVHEYLKSVNANVAAFKRFTLNQE